VLTIKSSSYFSWAGSDKDTKEKKKHDDYKVVENAFYFLKENAGARGIKGYLYHQKDIIFSRRKIGRIMDDLSLKLRFN
jgi:hypothetical protein